MNKTMFFVNSISGKIHEIEFKMCGDGILYALEHSLIIENCAIYINEKDTEYIEDFKERIVFDGKEYKKEECNIHAEYYIFDDIDSANNFSLSLKSENEIKLQINSILIKAKNELLNISKNNKSELIRDTVKHINSTITKN